MCSRVPPPICAYCFSLWFVSTEKGAFRSRWNAVVIRKMYVPCADKIPFCSLSSKIILNLLKADKLASGLDHTIHTILDTFMNSTIILQMKKLEIPFL